MARNLHRGGLLQTVWNRAAGRARSLAAELGVVAAPDPAGLAANCELVLLSVSRDADLLQVIEALSAGLHPNAVIVDTSTVSADTARRAAAKVRSQGAAFLDAPVSGGVEGARAGTLAMMVGGRAADLERARPALVALAARIVHMGEVGAGQVTKAVNQIMAAGINQAVSEALAFADASGLPMDKLIEVVGSGAAGNWFLDHRGASMVAGKYSPGFRVSLHHKDLEICRQMIRALGNGDVRLPIVEMTLTHYRRLMEAGFADEDISALYRSKRALFGGPS